MADFTIDITDTPVTPIVYTSHVGVKAVESCAPFTDHIYPIKVESTDHSEYAMMHSYSGDTWKYLTITGIGVNDDAEACNCVEIQYNSSTLLVGDLPLKLDIEALSAINNIPLLEIVANELNYNGNYKRPSLNITFTIEDINGTVGSSEQSAYQVSRTECAPLAPPTPLITSYLSYTIPLAYPTNHIFDYYITADNPVDLYDADGLPAGSVINTGTGFIRIDTEPLQERSTEVIIQFDISTYKEFATPTGDLKTFTLTIPSKVANDKLQ